MTSNNNQARAGSQVEQHLVNGSEPITSDQLINLLEQSRVPHKTVEHAPMWTVEDAKALRQPSAYGHTKNLFVRNKKGEMWLLTLHEDRKVNLKETAAMVGTNRFSFASEQRLMHYLGVSPGAVSPLSILNDVTGKVTLYMDASLFLAPELHVHPLVNTRTSTIDTKSLIDFLASRGHIAHRLDFNSEEDSNSRHATPDL